MESTMLAIAGGIIALLIGSNSWTMKRWMEAKDSKIEAYEERISNLKDRITFLETHKTTIEERLRDGACTFTDTRKRLEHMEESKMGRIEFQAFLSRYEDEIKTLKAFTNTITAKLESHQDKMDATVSRLESKFDAFKEMMANVVILGNSQSHRP